VQPGTLKLLQFLGVLWTLPNTMIGLAGVSILYRECAGMADYCGKVNHHATIDRLARDVEQAQRFWALLNQWSAR